jgi:hypothetical protein
MYNSVRKILVSKLLQVLNLYIIFMNNFLSPITSSIVIDCFRKDLNFGNFNFYQQTYGCSSCGDHDFFFFFRSIYLFVFIIVLVFIIFFFIK